MHGYSRLGRASGSPPSSPRFRRHSKGRGGGVGVGVDVKLLERWVYAVISAVYRRRGVLLFAPLLYVSAMLLYMGTMGFHLGFTTTTPSSAPPPPPLGSLYRSPQLFQHLWPYIQPQNNQTNNDLMMNVWNIKSRPSWKPCNNLQNSQAELPKSNGFLIIEANGGLNQQRLSICDAVAVAGLLNATLVIPIFHLNSVWRDSR
ncbi:putative GDP-fucose protein O-fucosyltransferase [Helianthus debilis subsp. tardiflorus]